MFEDKRKLDENKREPSSYTCIFLKMYKAVFVLALAAVAIGNSPIL
jgi:hypothetical protein